MYTNQQYISSTTAIQQQYISSTTAVQQLYISSTTSKQSIHVPHNELRPSCRNYSSLHSHPHTTSNVWMTVLWAARDIDREGGHPRAERNMLRQGDGGYGGTGQMN